MLAPGTVWNVPLCPSWSLAHSRYEYNMLASSQVCLLDTLHGHSTSCSLYLKLLISGTRKKLDVLAGYVLSR